jgi:hypothetical protein
VLFAVGIIGAALNGFITAAAAKGLLTYLGQALLSIIIVVGYVFLWRIMARLRPRAWSKAKGGNLFARVKIIGFWAFTLFAFLAVLLAGLWAVGMGSMVARFW